MSMWSIRGRGDGLFQGSDHEQNRKLEKRAILDVSDNCSYFFFSIGFVMTAVPQAEKSVAVPWSMSLVSKSALMTALAPILFAFSIDLFNDSFLAFSHSEVHDVTSPSEMSSMPAALIVNVIKLVAT